MSSTLNEALLKKLRTDALHMVSNGASHIGSVFSCIDIVATLYLRVMNGLDPADPRSGDRFIMSKGHAGVAMYTVLAEMGFIERDELDTFYRNGSRLSGHLSHHVPGVHVSTGSLGHGLSIGCGMAQAARMRDEDRRVFVLLSDGECDEGSTWESAMYASHHGLPVTVVIDYNKLQSLATTTSTLDLEPFADKWTSFGWDVHEVDGHDVDALDGVLSPVPSGPTCVIAHTVKGKGVSMMENSVLWHYRIPVGDELAAALEELA